MKVIAVDWSGDATRRGQQGHIWAATVEDGRLSDLSSGRTRNEVIDFLLAESGTDGELVVGLDFAFSFPAWFARQLGVDEIGELWDVAAREGEYWLSRCQPPFWGRPGTTRPVLAAHLRLTDSACKPVTGITPKSVFQIGGAGAVGTGSIRGMPYLRNLREGGFSVWPFDSPGRLTVIEIYPRVLTGPVRKSDPSERERYLRNWDMPEHFRRRATDSEDAFDAAVSALVMSRHADHLVALQPTTDPDVRLEGSIWVPALASASSPSSSFEADHAALPAPSDLRYEIELILRDLSAMEGRLDRARRAASALLGAEPVADPDDAEPI